VTSHACHPLDLPLRVVAVLLLVLYDTFAPPAIRERSIVLTVSACLSVCLSVCLSASISHISTHSIFTYFLCMLPVAVARSFSGGIANMYFRFFKDDVIFARKPRLLDAPPN